MIKLTIISQKHGTVFKEVENQMQVDAYITEVTLSQHWGRNAWTEIVKEAVHDDQGGIVEPEEVIEHPAEWSWSQEDITTEVEKKQKVSSRTDVRLFCNKIIDEIAVYNEENLSSEQMLSIFGSPAMQAIIFALLTGAPETAKNLMAAHGPSMYPQPMVDEFVAKLESLS